MSKYICKVLPTEDCNKDFAPDREMEEGIEVDGFILIGFNGGKPCFESMMGISVSNMSDWIRRNGPGGKKIRAACAIAEGEIRAKEIMEEDDDQGVTMTLPTLPMDAKTIRKILGQE